MGDDEVVGIYPKQLQLADDLVGRCGYPRLNKGRSRLFADEIEAEKRITQDPKPLIQASGKGCRSPLRWTSHGPEINPLRNP